MTNWKNETNLGLLQVFDEKIIQLKQTVQVLNEKFNERNKIENYLSKNFFFCGFILKK